MKKIILSLVLLLTLAMNAHAQFVASAHGAVSVNAPGFFSGYRDAYNTTNAATMKNKLGIPMFGYGYSMNAAYRVFHLTTSVGRTQLTAQTSAEYQNGSRRIFQYEYSFTTVTIGYFHYTDNSEWTIEAGMLHSASSAVSYVRYPDKTKDAFSGVSGAIYWANLGGTARFNYLRRLTDMIWLECAVQGFYLKNHEELAPTFGFNEKKATLDFYGATFSIGLAFRFGKHYD